MSPFAVLLLAFSMSVDSHLAAIGWGAGRRRLAPLEVVATGLLFAVVQMATPLIGWGLGAVASGFVEPIDHWLAFGLLAAVGGRTAYMAWRRVDGEDPDASSASTMATLLVTAIATSMDALAVGISLAFLDVDIVGITLAIGGATFVMAVGGLVMGRAISCRLGRCAEIFAGVLLVGLGVFILIEHLFG